MLQYSGIIAFCVAEFDRNHNFPLFTIDNTANDAFIDRWNNCTKYLSFADLHLMSFGKRISFRLQQCLSLRLVTKAPLRRGVKVFFLELL
jgi:hypothetical protein